VNTGAVAQALRALADAIEAEPPAERTDDLLDRRTCGISARLWDRMVKDGEIPFMRDGRRVVTYRRDVLQALERRRVMRKAEPEQRPPRDDDEATLLAAGIRLLR
jgi:hypothetical protein